MDWQMSQSNIGIGGKKVRNIETIVADFLEKNKPKHQQCYDHELCVCCLDDNNQITDVHRYDIKTESFKSETILPTPSLLDKRQHSGVSCSNYAGISNDIITPSGDNLKRFNNDDFYSNQTLHSKDNYSDHQPPNVVYDKGQEEEYDVKYENNIPVDVKTTVHYRCRHLLYPKLYRGSTSNGYNKDIYRVEVPDSLVLWSSKWNDYEPVDWSENIITSTGKTLNDVNIDSVKDSVWFSFNCVDRIRAPSGKVTNKIIDRRSRHSTYSLDGSGRPVNPIGRTGLRGRGCLNHWGPNHTYHFLISRWKDAYHQKLEFVSVYSLSLRQWIIPETQASVTRCIPDIVKATFIKELMNHTKVLSEQPLKKQMLEKFLDDDNAEVIYVGYLDDTRNTDNAWLETTILSYHDNDNETMRHFRLHDYRPSPTSEDVCWISIDSDVNMMPSHRDILLLLNKRFQLSW
ncbi:hypothetical protein GJ496_004042 [Pomphorhynchus laevis]|nr:hypothetical protein GJ496_004042 [Pomphorhynchus laevis]